MNRSEWWWLVMISCALSSMFFLLRHVLRWGVDDVSYVYVPRKLGVGEWRWFVVEL